MLDMFIFIENLPCFCLDVQKLFNKNCFNRFIDTNILLLCQKNVWMVQEVFILICCVKKNVWMVQEVFILNCCVKKNVWVVQEVFILICSVKKNVWMVQEVFILICCVKKKCLDGPRSVYFDFFLIF